MKLLEVFYVFGDCHWYDLAFWFRVNVWPGKLKLVVKLVKAVDNIGLYVMYLIISKLCIFMLTNSYGTGRLSST